MYDATDILDVIFNAVCTTIKIPFTWRQQEKRLENLAYSAQNVTLNTPKSDFVQIKVLFLHPHIDVLTQFCPN